MMDRLIAALAPGPRIDSALCLAGCSRCVEACTPGALVRGSAESSAQEFAGSAGQEPAGASGQAKTGRLVADGSGSAAAAATMALLGVTEPPELIGANCSGCGVCAAACPTGAITLPDLDLGALRMVLKAAPEPTLTCRRQPRAGAAEVPCLAGVPAEFLAGLALELGVPVTVVTAGCGGCSLGMAERVQATVRAAATLAAGLDPSGRTVVAAVADTGGSEPESGPSREPARTAATRAAAERGGTAARVIGAPGAPGGAATAGVVGGAAAAAAKSAGGSTTAGDGGAGVGVDRRRLFGIWRRGLVRTAAAAIPELPGEKGWARRARLPGAPPDGLRDQAAHGTDVYQELPPVRRYLLQVLSAREVESLAGAGASGGIETQVPRSADIGPGAAPRSMADAPPAPVPTAGLFLAHYTATEVCNACGLCAQACPTGALRLVRVGYESRLEHRLRDCLDCGLCLSSCSVGALQRSETVHLSDLRDGTVRVAVVVEPSRCVRCGRPFAPVDGEKECSQCQSRRSLLAAIPR